MQTNVPSQKWIVSIWSDFRTFRHMGFSGPYEGSACIAVTMQTTAKSDSLFIIAKPYTNRSVLKIWETDQSINQDTHTDVYHVTFMDIK